MPRLAGQVAIVTGGAQGIGGATSRRLAEEGAKVLVADIDSEAAARNVDAVRAGGGTAEAFTTDVAAPQAVKAMVDKAVDLWGGLDILVNNAFTATNPIRGGALEVTQENWKRGMAILVDAIFFGVKYAVPEMRKRGAGSIVNISSVHGLLAAEEWLVYDTAKTAVIGMTRQMAAQFGPMGIRVNAICPGHIVTERIQATMWDANPSGLRFFEQQYPLRRCGRPVDVANAVVFLCSEEASFITGHALVVDGGVTIQFQENLGVRLAHYLREHPDTRMPY